MPRRPLPINTWGEIHTRRVGHKRYEAHARFRHSDGVTRQHRRTGTTADDARDTLKTYFSELAAESLGDIDRDTRWGVICEAWLEDLVTRYRIEGKSPATPKAYRVTLRRWVLPSMGELRAREVTTRRVDALLQRVTQERSAGTARMVKKVIAGSSVYAIRMGAMDTSPVKSVGRIDGGKRLAPKSLTLEQRIDLLEKLDAAAIDTKSAVQRLLPDLTRMMLATGVRISEVLALHSDDVNLEAKTVTVGHHLVEPEGGGVRRMEGRKGEGRALVLGVPSWSWETFTQRVNGGPLLSKHGLYIRPSTVTARQRQVLREIGYGWVTSHVWRKTVATVLDEQGLSVTEAADQLGNTAAMVEGHYRSPRQTNHRAAAALEGALSKREVTVISGDQSTG